jgi:hypothetical protein
LTEIWASIIQLEEKVNQKQSNDQTGPLGQQASEQEIDQRTEETLPHKGII